MRRSSDCPEKELFPEAGDVSPVRPWEQPPQVPIAYEREDTHNNPLSSKMQVEDRDSETNVSMLEHACSSQFCHPMGEGVFSSVKRKCKFPVPPMQARTASHTPSIIESPPSSDDEGPVMHVRSAATSNATIFGHQTGPTLLPGTHASAAEPVASLLSYAERIFREGREAFRSTNVPDKDTLPFMHLGASSDSASSAESPRGSEKAPIPHHLLTRPQHASVLGQQSGQASLPDMHASAPEQVEPFHGLQPKQTESSSPMWQHFFMHGTEKLVAVCKICNKNVKLARRGDGKSLGTYPLRRHWVIFHSPLASQKLVLRGPDLGAAQLQLGAEEMEH
ncbi:uncharacterized protein LOC128323020 [Hemicordylus capensis]|uniref:uncharacterized protein LOC128323020 n=1 Tax=Hemicordylus capensis TaxID=884348 RepID=UPI0023044784|nr:uncharacterized protein LOC128323020 [Hemicordylus capensis]